MAHHLDDVGHIENVSGLRSTPCVPAPDPRPFKQAIPGRLFRRWEWGELSRRELWESLERLWGADDVARLVEGRRVA